RPPVRGGRAARGRARLPVRNRLALPRARRALDIIAREEERFESAVIRLRPAGHIGRGIRPAGAPWRGRAHPRRRPEPDSLAQHATVVSRTAGGHYWSCRPFRNRIFLERLADRRARYSRPDRKIAGRK